LRAPRLAAATSLQRLGHALSDANRCALLLALREGRRYPSDLAVELRLSKANVSNHLACLRGCGLVTAVQQGRYQRYQLADPLLAHALDDLLALAQVTVGTVCEVDAGVAS